VEETARRDVVVRAAELLRALGAEVRMAVVVELSIAPRCVRELQAALRSQARRLAGRATYMFDEATGHKLVLRLIFDLDNNGYAAAQLDPYAVQPVFAPDSSVSGRPIMMPAAIRIRDVTIEGIGTVNRGTVATTFYPEGYVDATVVHLDDASGDVMTLEFSPLTGQVTIISGDVMPSGMSR